MVYAPITINRDAPYVGVVDGLGAGRIVSITTTNGQSITAPAGECLQIGQFVFLKDGAAYATAIQQERGA